MVTMLTTKAELFTLLATAKEMIVICRLFSQIKFNPGTQLPIIECNNL